MATIKVESIESAINVWRAKSPASGDELALCHQARTLADVYALMIIRRLSEIDSESLTTEQQAAYDAAFIS